jgi:hypothetical protein
MSETLQTAKEEVQQELDVLKPGYKLSKLKLTEEDKNLYAESLATGNPFSHKFENGPLNVVFRDRTKRETDIIGRQTDKAYNEGRIFSPAEYANQFNLGCLYYQLEDVNGIKQNRNYPSSVWDMKDFDLLSEIDKGYLGGLTSSVLFTLMAMMTQFNQKLFDLSKEVLSGNFSTPAKDS